MRFKLGGNNYCVWVIASLMGLLIGANSLIKILRDSIFLGHHSVSELPYLYILVAIIAGVVIAAYSRYTAHTSILRLILATNGTILAAIIFFWVVLSYFDPPWSHYAFYIWSAMATVIAVAQVWTLANHIFTEAEGKRYFGLIAAGGTVGGIVASFGSSWSVHLSVESNHLFWVVAVIYVLGSLLVIAVESRFTRNATEPEIPSLEGPQAANRSDGIGALLLGSGYLRSIAVIILVSVIVSTLIDFEFKTAVKETYPSRRELAGFFSLYYGWLNVATLFVQVVLTGRILSKLGLASSLYLTPGTLLAGSLAIIASPGLLAPMLTRMADLILRNSVHRSAMEIAYMALPPNVVKAVKTFLDVVVERLGDATAGFVILLFAILPLQGHLAYVHFVCIGLIGTWFVLNWFLQFRYAEFVHRGALLKDETPRRSWLERELGG